MVTSLESFYVFRMFFREKGDLKIGVLKIYLKEPSDMNEIFPCLACYGQKLKFIVRKSRQR